MNPSRWAVLGLVLAALGASLAYGLKGSPAKAPDPALGQLQAQAALEPCPRSLGTAFPDLSLRCLGGGPDVRVKGTGTGRPTLVNVYGSWCGPCQKEMPVLRAFHAAHPDVGLVGVDTEEQSDTLGLRFALAVQQHWPAVADDRRQVGAHFGTGVPLMLFVSAGGAVKHVESGGYTALADLERDVRSYLGAPL